MFSLDLGDLICVIIYSCILNVQKLIVKVYVLLVLKLVLFKKVSNIHL